MQLQDRRCARARSAGPCTCSAARSTLGFPPGARCRKRPRARRSASPRTRRRRTRARLPRANARSTQVVVVRRHDEQLRQAALASSRRRAREQPVQRGRRVLGVEHLAQVAGRARPRRAPRRRTARRAAGRGRPDRIAAALGEVLARARRRSAGTGRPAHGVSSGRSQRFAPAPRNGTTSAARSGPRRGNSAARPLRPPTRRPSHFCRSSAARRKHDDRNPLNRLRASISTNDAVHAGTLTPARCKPTLDKT